MQWHVLTEDEKKTILHSWSLIEPHKQSVACDIYEMIFNQCPEARKLFPKMKFSSNKKERKNNEFVFQALRFMQVIEGAVTAIDNLDSLNNILDNLGRRHGKLEISGKFRSYYWSTFLECSIFCFRRTMDDSRKMNTERVDEAIIQWRVLLKDVMKKIKIGYQADIAHRMSRMSIDEENRKLSVPSVERQGSIEISADKSQHFRVPFGKNTN